MSYYLLILLALFSAFLSTLPLPSSAFSLSMIFLSSFSFPLYLSPSLPFRFFYAPSILVSLLQSLLELVFGVKVVITGDGFIPGERSVIIMNHRTRLDWMFLWCCLLRYSYLRLEKICLKAALKAVPGFGGYTVGALPFPTHKDTRVHLHKL